MKEAALVKVLRSIITVALDCNYDPSLYKYAQTPKRSSWAEFTVENDKLTVEVKYFDGTNTQVYHTWGIKKNSRVKCGH